MDLAALKVLAVNYNVAKALRLVADREARELKSKEDEYGDALIAICRDQGAGIDLGGVVVEYDTTLVPVAQDWNAIHEYIKDNDAIDLVHKRLTESAVKLRWDDGIAIPGVGDKLREKIKVTVND